MKLVIVDDEPLARERLTRMVADFPGWEIAAYATNGKEAVARILETEPDVVLMDIHMPGMDGLQAARQLAEMPVPPAVIFVTAHSEHALSAHDAAAAGYLLKPIRREQLEQALQRARRPSRAQLRTIDANAGNAMARQFIHATTREGVVRVPVDDVVYFLADQKYVTVYHLHGQLLIEDSLLSLQQDLDERFLRVHRKALVATRHILALVRDAKSGVCVKLRHATDLVPVSRRRQADVRRFLNLDQ